MKSIAWNIQDEWQPLEAVMVGIGAGMGLAPNPGRHLRPPIEKTR